jgi:hypothetical protein
MKVKHFVWVSFDLGVKGDYEGMYAWLDRHAAKECGDNLACFSYEHSRENLLQEIQEDLQDNIDIDFKKDRIYVVRLVNGEMKGKFIFGNRRNAPWTGAAGSGEQGEDYE